MNTNTNISIPQTILQTAGQTAPHRQNIQRPFLNINIQQKYFRQYQKAYNHKVKLKRRPLEVERNQIRETLAQTPDLDKVARLQLKVRLKELRETLKQDDYQTLKSQHVNMMVEICRRIIYQLRIENQRSHSLPLNATRPYEILTNNAELRYNLCGTTRRTMLNNRKRLITCGFILDTDHHRSLTNYKLFINPAMLFFYDTEHPRYSPISGNPLADQKTEECGFAPQSEENFSPKGKQKEHISTSVRSADNSPSRIEPSVERTLSERSPEDGQTGPTGKGQEADQVNYSTFAERAKGLGGAARARLLAKTEGYKSRLTLQMFLFLLLCEEKLWAGRDLNRQWLDETVVPALYRQWFAHIPEDQLPQTLEWYHQAINHQARWVEKQREKGKKAFTLLPGEFFARLEKPDLREKVQNGQYSHFHTQLQRCIDDERLKMKRQARKKQDRLQKQYEKWTARYFTEPNTAHYRQTLEALERLGPAYIQKFQSEAALMWQKNSA